MRISGSRFSFCLDAAFVRSVASNARMVAPEPPDRTASNKQDGLDGSPSEALSAYVAWLEGQRLAARSRQAYGHQVRRYLAWLGDRSPVDGDDEREPRVE